MTTYHRTNEATIKNKPHINIRVDKILAGPTYLVNTTCLTNIYFQTLPTNTNQIINRKQPAWAEKSEPPVSCMYTCGHHKLYSDTTRRASNQEKTSSRVYSESRGGAQQCRASLGAMQNTRMGIIFFVSATRSCLHTKTAIMPTDSTRDIWMTMTVTSLQPKNATSTYAANTASS